MFAIVCLLMISDVIFLSMTSHFFLALREACSTELFLLGVFTGSPVDLPAAPENLELDVEALTDTEELE